jgi:hypothetical protein
MRDQGRCGLRSEGPDRQYPLRPHGRARCDGGWKWSASARPTKDSRPAFRPHMIELPLNGQCLVPALPFRVRREDLIAFCHYRMAREPALGIVRLRRLIRECAGPERLGGGVILKLGISPSAP